LIGSAGKLIGSRKKLIWFGGKIDLVRRKKSVRFAEKIDLVQRKNRFGLEKN
jgi:hypothetical protein